MAGYTYTVTTTSAGSTSSWSGVSDSGQKYGNDTKLTITASGAISLSLALGSGLKCHGYSYNSGTGRGEYKFTAYLFLSRWDSTQTAVSGSTLYVGSTGTMNYDGGNPGVTGFHDSNIQVRDLTASAGFGSYSSDSYKSNGVIAVSNQFSVAAGSNFSVSWGITIGGVYVHPGAISVTTNSKYAEMNYDYQGFSGGSTYKRTGTVGETITLVNASSCTKAASPSYQTNYISFNLNGGEGSYSNISESYTKYTTYTPQGWYVDGSSSYYTFGSSFTLSDNHSAKLAYKSTTGDYEYKTVTLPANVPTKYGYTFTGWLSGAGGTYQPSSSVYLNQNYTMTAQYSANTYTIRYHADSWSNVPADITVSYNAELIISSNVLTRNGSNWDGKWKTSDGRVINRGGWIRCSDYYELATKNNNTLDLYLNSYTLATNTITLNANGGTLNTSNTIQYNIETPVTSIPQPTPPVGDYIFVGWTSNKSICGQSYKDVTIISFNPANETDWNRSDITLTARYVRLGKFVNIRGSWRPVLETWYKRNGSWVCTENAIDPNKGVGNTMIKVNGSWHKEIGS